MKISTLNQFYSFDGAVNGCGWAGRIACLLDRIYPASSMSYGLSKILHIFHHNFAGCSLGIRGKIINT